MAPGLRSAILALAGAALPRLGRAHGRLTVPTPRVGGPGIYENDPVASETGDDFVCRRASPNSAIERPTVQAGQPFNVQWYFGAEHVGDCAVFISYDVNAERRNQRYVKIANLPDCKSKNNQPVTIDIPSGLPRGNAILRWDWVALHVYPTVEWYVQCADIYIDSTVQESIPATSSFSIIQPPIYPSSGDVGTGFRNPWGDGRSPGDSGYYITGPACFDGTLTVRNHCDETAPGTRGFTGQPGSAGGSAGGSGGGSAGGSTGGSAGVDAGGEAGGSTGWDDTWGSGSGDGSAGSGSSGSSSEGTSTAAPCVPVGDCGALGWCSQSEFVDFCSEQGAGCSGVFCRLEGTTGGAATGTTGGAATGTTGGAATGTGGAAVGGGATGTGATGGSGGSCATVTWGMCGGQYYSGDGCCPAGSTCTYVNFALSQCEPNSLLQAGKSSAAPSTAEQRPLTHASRATAVRPHGHLRQDSKGVRGTAMVHLGSTLERRSASEDEGEAVEMLEPWSAAAEAAALRDEF